MKELIKNIIQENIETKEKILSDPFISQIEKAVQLLTQTYKNNGKLILCGNGGSAADAQHIAAELVGRFQQNRQSLPALALNTNSSSLTSIANDFGYEESFSRQVEAFFQKEDLLLVISTSGNSKNILKAVQVAKTKKGKVIGLTGNQGGELKDQVDLLLNVPSTSTPRIQETHILIGHILCDLLEKELFST